MEQVLITEPTFNQKNDWAISRLPKLYCSGSTDKTTKGGRLYLDGKLYQVEMKLVKIEE